MAVAKASWELRTGLPGTLPRDGLGTVHQQPPLKRKPVTQARAGRQRAGALSDAVTAVIVVTFYPRDTRGRRGQRSEVPLGQRVRGGASLLPQCCPLVDTSAGVGESPRPAAGLGEELDWLSPRSGQDGEASPEGALGPREHSERVHRCGMPPTSRGGHWLLGS